MRPIKYSKDILSKGGKSYSLPQPNLESVNRLFNDFTECLAESLKPVGMTLDSRSTLPIWKGSNRVDTFNLTTLDKLTFTITLVSSKKRVSR